MPPYDKHIVLGPKHASKVAESIKRGLGCFGAAVADVNDLKRSCVLGATKGVDPLLWKRSSSTTPSANASQKTPICIIKDFIR